MGIENTLGDFARLVALASKFGPAVVDGLLSLGKLFVFTNPTDYADLLKRSEVLEARTAHNAGLDAPAAPRMTPRLRAELAKQAVASAVSTPAVAQIHDTPTVEDVADLSRRNVEANDAFVRNVLTTPTGEHGANPPPPVEPEDAFEAAPDVEPEPAAQKKKEVLTTRKRKK